VTVGLRKGGASWDKAKKAGIPVKEVGDAVKGCRLVMILLPDEHHAGVSQRDRAQHPQGRDARVRARLQHPLQADRAAQAISTSS
jgi:hypothetical protein